MKKRTAPLLALVTVAIGLSLAACSGTPGQGSADTGSHQTARIPGSFPQREVPLLAGRVLVASGDTADGWSVTVAPTSGDLASAEASLKNAGFVATRTTTSSATLADAGYTVTVQTPGKTVTYIVTKR